jgi:glycosyltransferase involved in cell wall biosynthesis
MRRKLIGLGAPENKIHYNPYGVDCDTFKVSDPSAAVPVLLAVGRFVDKKAPHLTIRAFAVARKDCPNARLRMIGDGPLLSQCRDLVDRLCLRESVEFLGAQPPEVVRKELRQARAFVQHSVEAASGDSEGLPNTILEAGASGLPVIATRHAGIPEAVVEGETGLLVDEGDVSAMAMGMSQLLLEPQLARRLGHAARQRMVNCFSIERSISGLWQILMSCLRTSSKRVNLSCSNVLSAVGR